MMAGQVRGNGQFGLAMATQYRFHMMFLFVPSLGRVAGCFLVALVAGVVLLAAFEPDGYDVFVGPGSKIQKLSLRIT